MICAAADPRCALAVESRPLLADRMRPMGASSEEVADSLKRAMPEGRLKRLPRHPRRRDIVLAVLSMPLRRRYPYSERELNDQLERSLARLGAEVDHVTCRRYLVDFGFVRRDRAGKRYFVNYPRVEDTLSGDAMANVELLVASALAVRA